MRRAAAWLALHLAASTSLAQGVPPEAPPSRSPLPEARQQGEAAGSAAPDAAAATGNAGADASNETDEGGAASANSATGASADPDAETGATAGLCGDPGLVGVPVSGIRGRVNGCGLRQGVAVTKIDGIALSQPATLDCRTALALAEWLREVARPVIGARGDGLTGLSISGHYICRPRNNRPGARISEHGRGRAIDISGLTLADGTVITVLEGWRDATAGPQLRRLHRGACGRFATVLGPDANRLHRDHFHFDTARNRRRPYCR
jgi:hypothetical protein